MLHRCESIACDSAWAEAVHFLVALPCQNNKLAPSRQRKRTTSLSSPSVAALIPLVDLCVVLPPLFGIKGISEVSVQIFKASSKLSKVTQCPLRERLSVGIAKRFKACLRVRAKLAAERGRSVRATTIVELPERKIELRAMFLAVQVCSRSACSSLSWSLARKALEHSIYLRSWHIPGHVVVKCRRQVQDAASIYVDELSLALYVGGRQQAVTERSVDNGRQTRT